MAKFNTEQQDEINKTLGFWNAFAIEKETAAKNGGYTKKAEATAYRATYRAISKLTQHPKHEKEQKLFQIFWGAAIKRWDIDFIRYIPLQLSRMYEQYYIVPPISLKARNAHVAKILTAIKKLEKHILKAGAHGNALNDRFSFIVSESYQPDDIGKHPNLDTIGFYPLLKGLQAEIKSLCQSKSYIGFGNEENSISAQERRYIKKYRNDITKYIERIADYSRDDDLGSFLEQAFSAVRKDQFFPKQSRIPKPEYQIIPILTFWAEMKDAIITLKSDKFFYKHHLTVTENAKLKAFGLSIQNMVKDISGVKHSAIITECILGRLLPDPNVTADQIHNWNKKPKNS